jgi:hypothetical protein
MSDTSQGPGWWLASDGRWYPPHLAPGAQPPQTPPTVPAASGPSVSRSLTQATQIVFGFVGGLELLVVVAVLRARSAFATAWDASWDMGAWNDAVAADERLASFERLALIAQIGAVVLLIVWMWRAHRTGDRLQPGDRDWAKGWTIGAWIIPIANFVLPRKVLSDIERVARAPRDGGKVSMAWRTTKTLPVGQLAWLLMVGGALTSRVAGQMMASAVEDFDPAGAESAYAVGAWGYSALALGLLLLVPLVGHIGRRLTEESLSTSDQMEESLS